MLPTIAGYDIRSPLFAHRSYESYTTIAVILEQELKEVSCYA